MSRARSSGAGDPTRLDAKQPPMTGAELKERRLRLGLSQAQFGKLIGVSRYTIARSEHGHPSESVIMRVALRVKEPRRRAGLVH
jgi:DNA-binding XRE family transcriptional regulator